MPPAQPPPPTPARRFSWPLLAVIVLGASLLATYANSFRVPFIFDDASSIAENPTLRSWKTIFFPPGDSGLTVSGRPLLNATLALNYALSRENVFGYHVTNLAIHFLAALTLFGLTRRTLQLPSATRHSALNSQLTSAAPIALVVSALWALHPLQTESVTYIIQRAESLVGLFYLLTLYCFVRSIDTPASRRRWQIAAFLSCLAGMASKEVMVSAPLVVFLFDRTFAADSFAQAWRERCRLHLAFVSTWILLAACIISTGNRGGTVGTNEVINAWTYFATQCHALTHYLRLTFWPHPLVLDYGTGVVNSLGEVAGRFVFLLSLGLATLWALWKRPAIGFLGFVFFAVLAPTSSFVPVTTQTMAEHRMYLALAPLVLGVVLLLNRAPRFTGLIGASLLAVAAGITSFNRNQDYRDAFTLWENTRALAPLNARAPINLGSLYAKQHDYTRALEQFQQAAEIAPNDMAARTGIANSLAGLNRVTEAIDIYRRVLAIKPDLHDAHYNLGKVLLEQNDVVGAIAHLTRATELKPSSTDATYNLGNALLASGRPADAAANYRKVLAADPDAIDARNNLGNALATLGHPDAAIGEYRIVLEKSPGHPRALINLGRAHALLGRTNDALACFQQAASAAPEIPEAHANLANALLAHSRASEAIPHFEAALRLGLKDPALRLNLGNALTLSNRLDDAIVHYRALVSDFPNYTDAVNRLAVPLLQTGRPDEAIPHYQQLLLLAPDSAEFANNLGIAYAQLGQMDNARTYFRQALRLNPNFTEARENLERSQR